MKIDHVRVEQELSIRENYIGRIVELERSGKVLVKWHPNYKSVLLTNPRTPRSHVEFFPTRGTVMRNHVKQFRRGLDHALKLIGIQP